MKSNDPARLHARAPQIGLRRHLARATRKLQIRLGLAKLDVHPFGEAEIVPATGVIRGWVDNQDGVSEVEIHLNGRLLATTFPGRPQPIDGEVRQIGFSRSLKRIWPMLGRNDRVQVLYQGKALPIIGHGTEWRGDENRPSQSGLILKRLSQKYVVNKYGRLSLGIRDNQSYKSWVFDTADTVIDEVFDILGYRAFPFYGSMLGAVREADFIGHDNDFDMIYISKFSEKEEILSEYYRLCKDLIDRGHFIKVKGTHLWIRRRNSKQKIDLFFGWFDKLGYFHVSNGYHHDAVHRSVGFDEFLPHKMSNHTIFLPSGAEEILNQLYGPNWRVPDRGFHHESSTLRVDKRFWLNNARVLDLYWRQYYRDNTESHISTFAHWVTERLSPDEAVVEIGCGSGGDAAFFALQNRRVSAIDRSPEAVAAARSHLVREGVADRVSLQRMNASNKKKLGRFLDDSLKPGPTLLYLRFYLHAVPTRARLALYEQLPRLPAGTRVALEFRTRQDISSRTVRSPLRWYINTDIIVTRLRDSGYEIEEMLSGRGLSPWRGEDPHLARIIARKLP